MGVRDGLFFCFFLAVRRADSVGGDGCSSYLCARFLKHFLFTVLGGSFLQIFVNKFFK